MSWNPEEYSDGVEQESTQLQADGVLQSIETEHEEEVMHQQTVVETLTEAMKRIEEANLWKTLLTMDVFQSGSARPEIVNSINAKIKKVALEQLELCVGIRSEKPVQQQTPIEVKLPFDTEEMQALKILAAKVLKRDVTQAVVSGYTPQIAQVASKTPAPALNTVRVNTPAVPKSNTAPAPQPKKAKPAESTAKKRPNRPQPGPGYIPPPGSYAMNPQSGATVTTSGNVGSVNMQNLVSQLVQSASGGNLISQAAPSDDGSGGINDRF